MSRLAPRLDLPALGTVLMVWAHPDDETYLAGGLSASLTRQHQRVVCVTATRGEAGSTDQSPSARARLSEIRSRELEDALAVLGVEEHHWLAYLDGECADVDPQEAGQQIATILDKVAADTVITFGPEGVTGHPDHRAVSRWVDVAMTLSAREPRLLHAVTTEEGRALDPALDHDFGIYELGSPRVCEPEELVVHLPLSGRLLDLKVAALELQRSQTARLIEGVGVSRYRAWVSVESFAAPA